MLKEPWIYTSVVLPGAWSMRIVESLTNLDETGHPTNKSTGVLATTGEPVRYEPHPICSFVVDNSLVDIWIEQKRRWESASPEEREEICRNGY